MILVQTAIEYQYGISVQHKFSPFLFLACAYVHMIRVSVRYVQYNLRKRGFLHVIVYVGLIRTDGVIVDLSPLGLNSIEFSSETAVCTLKVSVI